MICRMSPWRHLHRVRFAAPWLLMGGVSVAAGVSPWAAWATMAAVQVLLALAERVPALQRSPAAEPQTAWHRACVRLQLPLQTALLAYGLHLVVAGGHGYAAAAALGVAVGGVTGSQGITFAGSFASAWRLEALRLRQRQRGWVASPLLWASVAQGALVLGVALLLGWAALVFWLVQAAHAVFLLETVNYIEHYGLQREPGQPFDQQHAWNADHLLTNSLLANLQRHSDHHMHAWKPYAELQPLPGPQLPTGYAGCLFLATVPPLWFAAMEPRLAASG